MSPLVEVRPMTPVSGLPRKPAPINVLPKEARDRLIAASQIENEKLRAISIDEATKYVRHHHPKFFQIGATP